MVRLFSNSSTPCSRLLVFPGINSFEGNVLLKDFQLPSDSPEGGFNFVAVTQLNNPRSLFSCFCSHDDI